VSDLSTVNCTNKQVNDCEIRGSGSGDSGGGGDDDNDDEGGQRKQYARFLNGAFRIVGGVGGVGC
jgi:hypothetical protein